MEDERTATAVARIERALARIEAACAARPEVGNGEELHELRARHQALREKVEGAVSQIDRLLARGES